MQVYWGLGLILAMLALAVGVYFVRASWRRRASSRRSAPVDLMLDDLEDLSTEPKRRRGEFVDDTAPAVLSVPPEFEHPEWDNPNWEPPKRPVSQRWLH